MRVIALFLIFVLFFSMPSVLGQEYFTVKTDKNDYSQGDTIYVSGHVTDIRFGSEVNLMLVSPNGDIIMIKKLTVNTNKQFQTDILVDKSVMQSSGKYVLVASYGSETGSSQINISYAQTQNFLGKEDPKRNVLLNFDFIKPNKNGIQEHVDYKITVSKKGDVIYGPTPIIHSTTGSVSTSLMVNQSESYDVLIEVYGVLFQQSPVETALFSIMSSSKTIQSEFTSKNTLKINLSVNRDPSPDPKVIPDWVKNNAKWWALGAIDDESFVNSIEYLIENKIVKIPDLPYPASWMDKSVPLWVKNHAAWWAEDLILEDDFIKGIKFLVEKGVIQINAFESTHVPVKLF